MARLLSPAGRLNCRSDIVRLRSVLAFGVAEEGLLPRRHLPHLLHSATPAHIGLLQPDLLPRLEPRVSERQRWNGHFEHLVDHLPLEGQGPEDVDRRRHPLRFLLAASVRSQHAHLLRTTDGRRRVDANRCSCLPMAWIVQQLRQSDHLLSLQQEVPNGDQTLAQLFGACARTRSSDDADLARWQPHLQRPGNGGREGEANAQEVRSVSWSLAEGR